MVCKACTVTMRRWTNGKRSLNFGIPMVWREPTNHLTDCYFCAVDVTGINRKNQDSLKYPDLQSARRPVAHCDEIPVPIFGELPDICDEDASSVEGDEDEEEDNTPHPFSQKELNDLVRDLSLSKDSAELLASRLKEKNLHSDSARISFFRNRHQEYLRFFSTVKDLMYSADIALLLLKLGVPQYERKDGRLFIDSSKQSLKWVYYPTAVSLPLYPSLTRLHWRRRMKRRSMCKRKLVMISISGLFVLTWRRWTFCWDNSLGSPSTHVFCACGIVGAELSITRRRTGLCERNWWLAKKGTSSTTLWWTETEYSAYRYTSRSV